MKKINFIEMLQGCSKRNGTTFRQSNPDGGQTCDVNRQSRLMSYRGSLRNLAMIFAVLVMSVANVGTAWGTEYNLLNHSTKALTGEFRCNNSVSNDAQTFSGKTFACYVVTSGNQSSWSNGYAEAKTIDYDVKTTSTTFTIYVGNTSSDTPELYYVVYDESTSAHSSPDVAQTKIGETIPKGNSTPQYTTRSFTVTRSKNARVCIYTTKAGNTKIYQIVASETGSDLPKVGEGGYVLNMNKGRFGLNASKYGKIDNNIEIYAYANYAMANAANVQFDKNKTSSVYIKFTTPASPGKLKLTWSGGQMAYNTSASGTGATSITSDSEYTLSGNTTYYLVNTGSATSSVTNLQFIASACTPPNHVDVSGTYHFFPGETITLSATAYSSAGTSSPITSDITYQWQKYVGSDFVDIDGATSATFTKNGATIEDVGQYRCVATVGGSCSTASAATKEAAQNVKCLQLYVYWDDNSDKCNLPLTKVDGSNATALVFLENGSYTYHFKITDGCGNWYGNDGTMTSSNCTGWNMDKNSYCGLTTTKSATYTLNVNYSNLALPQVSVVYPSTVQTGGYNLYFANNERNWSNIHYRIGRSNWNSKAAMTLVPGTANLYQTTTIHYESDGGFDAWHIANNGGWSNGNSIYKTKTGDGNAITNATRFEGAPVPSTGLTVIPGSDHSTGGDAQNNNCEFYSYTSVPGLWTHTATVGATTNGSIRLNWTDINNDAQSATSTTAGLAHTCNLQVTAVPATGYETATLTVNGSNHTSGNVHVLNANATIAATFSLVNYNVTYSAPSNGSYTIKVGDGSASSATKTATMGQTVAIVATPADASYEFTGWTVTNTSSSADVTSTLLAGDKATTASTNFTMPAYGVTIVATFAKKTYTVTYNKGTGDITGSHANDTKTHGVNLTLPGATFSKTGYTQTGWATEDGGSKVYELSGSYTANAAANLYPVWTAKTTTISINANTGNHGSSTPGNVTATFGSALPSFTAAAGESGYSLTGYFTTATSGTKVINADGSLVRNTTYATDESTPKWKSEAATLTLFAQYEEEAEACYEFTPATSGSAPSEGDVISGTGSGGTMVAGTGQSYTTNGLKFESTGSNRYVTVTLDNNLKEGSVIAVTMWMDGTSSNRGLYLQTSAGTQKAEWKFTADSENHEFSYTVEAGDGLINTNVFRLARINNVYLKTVTVSNCGDAACTTPTTAFANGAYTVGGSALNLSTLWTSNSSGAVTYTVKNANGTGATIAGTNFSATSAGTATVTATQAADATYCEKVMDATITVSAADACPTAASGEVVYKFVTKSSGLGTSAICANKDQDYPLSTGDGNPLETLTNGSLTARASSAGTTQLKYNTSSINFNGGSNGWLIIGLDCPIKSGDVIRYVNNNSGSVAIRTAKGTSENEIVLAGNSKTDIQTVVISSAQATAFNELTTVYMVRKSGTSDISYFEIIRPYVVTLDANTNGGKVNGENTEVHYMLSGESLVLPHATKSGYRFKGWYTTSDGSTKASTNYSPTGTTTLYAQFEDCPGSGTVYKWEVKSGLENGSLPVGVSGEAEMDADEGNYLSTLIGGTLTLHNKNNHIKISDNSKFSIDDNAPYIIVNLDCALEAGDKFVATVGSHTAYVTKTSSRASTVELPTGTKAETAVPESLEGASTLYIWRGSGNYKISYFEITRTSTTYTVSYDGNGGSGTAPTDGTAYARNAEVTVKGNTGSLTKSNYAALAYWNTEDDGSGTDYAISTGTFEITADVTLYAKWTQAVTFDANTANHGSAGGSATAVWNATALTGITHATPASGYKLLGYYTTASGDGVKVLNSDGTFAATNVTDYITSGKWSRTGAAPTLYARYESSGSLIWNLGVNTDATSLTTSSKNSDFSQIAVANMTNAALTGISYSKSKKSELTGIIETPTSYDGAKYVSVTFQVAAGYKFTPSSVKVKVQPKDNAKTVKLELSDASTHSQDYTSGSQSAGSIHTVTMTGDGTFYTGTVTLKIYCYGASGGYRLGTPISIEGEVEATCTMPSFDGLNYEQTSYSLEDDASAITVTNPANVTTYAWKQNTTNDRSGTTPASGTNNTASYTPPTSAAGTLYYWCELTNACGTVKTPAVGITVSATKSDATISWTGTSASANYGGGGYTVKATVNETGWNGAAADLTLSAPAGIRIYNVSSGTDGSSKKYVQASFDVTTAFDRETYSSTIPFTVSADATATYNAISDEHAVSYEACTGAGVGASYNIRMRKVVTKDGNYYHCANTDGWISSNISSSHSTTKASSTMAAVFDTVASSNTQYVWVRTYHADINKVRIYADFRADNMTVANVYKSTNYFSADSKYAVDYTAIYNGSEGNEDLGSAAQGYVDIELDNVMAANDVLLVAFSTNRVRPLGAVITEGSAGSLTTTLTWSGGIADGGTVSGKTQSSANFTYTASKTGANNNSLGAITYTSSNTSCATVDPSSGEVTITASGASDLSTIITATLAASGCYKQKSITYSFTIPGVSCTVEPGTLSSDVTSKCETEDATLTLTDFESGATVQWYNGETLISDGSTYHITTEGTTSTLVTKAEGTYSVMVTNATCSDRSNSITITNKSTSVHVTRLVKEWYIKNGRLTPDIALWELGDDCTFVSVSVTPSDGWDANTGLTAASSFYEQDGIVYLKGTEPNANAGAVQNYTLKLTVNDGCGNQTLDAEGKKITIHHQQNTDKHVLAFVVRGTDKGDWTAGVTADQTTNVGLYNAIAANFDVLATNSRSTDDEQKLKEYYSQFDILCITDYPDTKKDKGVNGKSTVDALGALVDIRPILTMEAWVSGLANWRAKGISGSPKSPTTRQYTMDLQCKDHEIFAGTELTKVGEGDEAMYRVSMVDNTKEDYATLDATYGGGAHAEKDGYNYGGKPALQGFTFTQEMSNNDLLPIGLIDDGAGNNLQVGIERQHNMEARLMVLGINSYAMERLTDDGERVVINALNYLMKKNAEDIADCSTAFVGGAEGHEKNWDYADNWTGNTVPLATQKVRILADCEVSSTVYAQSVLIVTDGKYNHGSDTAAGKLTIKENGALIVGGKIQAASAPAYNKTRATTPDKLLIKTSSTNQAALIFDNEEAETQATVNLYSLGRKPSSYQYQYFAVPMEAVPVNPTFANEAHDGTGIYTYVYNEATSGWERRRYYDDLFAFEGLGITTKSTTAMEYEMKGNLASTATKEITLTHGGAGLNLIGNSWMAPIQIGALAEDNTDANITQTVYIYCAGRDAVEGEATSGVTETAGQWIAIPFEAAEFATWKATGKLSVIPAMQAFEIKVSAEATLTLDYKKVVRGSTNDLNAKLRAPGRPMAANEVTMTNIRVADSKTHTDLSLFEGDRFSEAFDNGWEAEYMSGDGRSAKLYAETEDGQMAVAAMYDYEGTVVGFAPGKETEYTFSFMGDDNGYYLNDIKLRNSVRISEGETYTFTYEDGDDANRFYISRTAINAPAVTTGMENLDAATPRAQKIIYNDKLYIIRGGRLYDATGKVVK